MSKKSTSNRSKTNIKKLEEMKDEDIDFSDIPPLTPEMFANAVVRKNLKPVKPKKQITLRIDNDVIEFFKSQGKGYQTRINQLLRAYMEEVKKTA